MIRRRTLEEVLNRIGELEAAIAAVELAFTRLEFALMRLPLDAKVSGRPILLETAEAYRACLAVLFEEHKLLLGDLERKRCSAGTTAGNR